MYFIYVIPIKKLLIFSPCFLRYIQKKNKKKNEYLIQKMIPQVTQILIPHRSWFFEFIVFVWPFVLSNSLWVLNFLPLLELINIVSILFYNFIEFIVLLHTFLVISFARYKDYVISPILFSKFSDLLPTFTCASAIGNPWSIF